jgi:hypothetical protein
MKNTMQDPSSETNVATVAHTPTSRARRAKPGRKALSEIKKLQSTPDKHIVPRESLRRFIAEVVQNYGTDYCISAEAVEALRVAAESELVQTFGLAGSLSNEVAKKDTVDLASFRAAANILNADHKFSTAGVVAGSLTSRLF